MKSTTETFNWLLQNVGNSFPVKTTKRFLGLNIPVTKGWMYLDAEKECNSIHISNGAEAKNPNKSVGFWVEIDKKTGVLKVAYKIRGLNVSLEENPMVASMFYKLASLLMTEAYEFYARKQSKTITEVVGQNGESVSLSA